MENVHELEEVEARSDLQREAQRENDPRWALARRISRSAAFAKSDRLPRMLLFVCRMHMEGRDDEVNEQLLGREIFRRAANYDSGADSIVRSHATRLRHRLDVYFHTEGAAEIMRLEIPRGGYTPLFTEPPSVIEETAAMPIDAVFRKEAEGPMQARSWILPFVAGLILSALTAAVYLHLRHDAAQVLSHDAGEHQSDIERRFWSTLMSPQRRTLVVSGDSGLVLFETYARHEVMLSDYLSGSYLHNLQSRADHDPEVRTQIDLGRRRYTSMIDLELTSRISHLPQWSSNTVQTVFARDVRAADIEKSNLILLGSRQANPWVGLYEPGENFLLTHDAHYQFSFLNRRPLPGEQLRYSPINDPGGGAPSVFGLISYQNNGNDGGHVLILSGLWVSGTASSGNFILGDQQFSRFLSSIVLQDRTIPPFELLIKTQSLSGNSMRSTIVAQRIGS